MKQDALLSSQGCVAALCTVCTGAVLRWCCAMYGIGTTLCRLCTMAMLCFAVLCGSVVNCAVHDTLMRFELEVGNLNPTVSCSGRVFQGRRGAVHDVAQCHVRKKQKITGLRGCIVYFEPNCAVLCATP